MNYSHCSKEYRLTTRTTLYIYGPIMDHNTRIKSNYSALFVVTWKQPWCKELHLRGWEQSYMDDKTLEYYSPRFIAKTPDEAETLAIEMYEQWIMLNPEHQGYRLDRLGNIVFDIWDEILNILWYPASWITSIMRYLKQYNNKKGA